MENIKSLVGFAFEYGHFGTPVVTRHCVTRIPQPCPQTHATPSDEATGTALVPPSDVAWLWHAHRLAPRSYGRARNQRQVPNAPASCFTMQTQTDDGGIEVVNSTDSAAQATRVRWDTLYPDEPFFFTAEVEDEQQDEGQNAYGTVSGFDVVASAERQRTFLWQVSGPRYADPEFLREGVTAYGRFLHVMRVYPGAFLIPSYQVMSPPVQFAYMYFTRGGPSHPTIALPD